jgi:hypothetical protein
MTPLLLTLASLTPGDAGRPGGGAAREQVAVKLGDGFKGLLRVGPCVRRVALKGALFVLDDEGVKACYCFTGCTLAGDGAGRFKLTWGQGQQAYRGRAQSTPRGVKLVLDPVPTKPPPAGRLLLSDILRESSLPPKP